VVILNGILEKYFSGCGEANLVTQDRDQYRNIVNMNIKLRQLQTSKMFLNSLIFQLLWRTVFHGLRYVKLLRTSNEFHLALNLLLQRILSRLIFYHSILRMTTMANWLKEQFC